MALLRRYRALLRNIGPFCGNIGLFGQSVVISDSIALNGPQPTLVCVLRAVLRDAGLFWGDVVLFWRDRVLLGIQGAFTEIRDPFVELLGSFVEI